MAKTCTAWEALHEFGGLAAGTRCQASNPAIHKAGRAVYERLESGELCATGYLNGAAERTAIPADAWAWLSFTLRVDRESAAIGDGTTPTHRWVGVEITRPRPHKVTARPPFERALVAAISDAKRSRSRVTKPAVLALAREYDVSQAVALEAWRAKKPKGWAKPGAVKRA